MKVHNPKGRVQVERQTTAKVTSKLTFGESVTLQGRIGHGGSLGSPMLYADNGAIFPLIMDESQGKRFNAALNGRNVDSIETRAAVSGQMATDEGGTRFIKVASLVLSNSGTTKGAPTSFGPGGGRDLGSA